MWKYCKRKNYLIASDISFNHMPNPYCLPGKVKNQVICDLTLLNPLAITSLNPHFYDTRQVTGLTLGSVKLLSFPKLDLFQMRGSVKPYELVRKALLRSRAKMNLSQLKC